MTKKYGDHTNPNRFSKDPPVPHKAVTDDLHVMLNTKLFIMISFNNIFKRGHISSAHMNVQ